MVNTLNMAAEFLCLVPKSDMRNFFGDIINKQDSLSYYKRLCIIKEIRLQIYFYQSTDHF